MKKLLLVLFEMLICGALLGMPMKSFADDESPPADRSMASVDDQSEADAVHQLGNQDNFQPSNDMDSATENAPAGE